jgi:pimeloyl-ACP methyl ester carboxylesterase
MAVFSRGDVHLHYDEHGDASAFPLLLIAPGGMRSAADFWAKVPFDPIDALARHYRVISMDQRNAGRSTGPIEPDHGWPTYAADQLALMDHVGAERFHVIGMCIGGAYVMSLAVAAPERITAAITLQTIGLTDNRPAFYEVFDPWAAEQAPHHPEATAADWARFREAMYGGDGFLFAVSEAQAAACTTPLLVCMGNDQYHPQASSRRLAAVAPNATLVEQWKEPEHQAAALATIESFLAAHTPA